MKTRSNKEYLLMNTLTRESREYLLMNILTRESREYLLSRESGAGVIDGIDRCVIADGVC
jgi:hypothetical protein